MVLTQTNKLKKYINNNIYYLKFKIEAFLKLIYKLELIVRLKKKNLFILFRLKKQLYSLCI